MPYLFNRDLITVPEAAMVHMAACCVAASTRRPYAFIEDAWELTSCSECRNKFWRGELEERNGQLLCERCAPDVETMEAA